MDKQSLTITDIVALWGAITGTVSIVIAIFTYNRDRAKIKVSLKRNWRVVNHPHYDPSEDYAVLTVNNKGRRPVAIINAGYVFLKRKGGAIFSDAILHGSRELTEGKSTDYLIKEKDLDAISDIEYFAAYDAIGNEYKKYVSPLHKRLFYKILYLLHIKKRASLKKEA